MADAVITKRQDERLDDGEAAETAIPLNDFPGQIADPVEQPDIRIVPDVIEPGRALALSDFKAPSHGVGERFIRLAYRMGVPGGVLTGPFRKPPKTRLLATVTNPLPGDKGAIASALITDGGSSVVT